MKFGTVTTEKMGVNYLSIALLKTGLIDTDIKQNDKTMVWDGEIYLHSNINFSKSTLKTSIPVQVKSHFVKKFNDNIPIGLIDIEKFIIKEKVVYFVVQFLNKNNFKIFYKTMLLWDMRKLVSVANGQKTKNLKFKELPIEQSEKILQIITNFAKHADNQGEVLPQILSIGDALTKVDGLNRNIGFNIQVPNNCTIEDIYNGIKNQNPYIYLEDNAGFRAIIDKFENLKNIEIVQNEKIVVSVDDKVIYNNCQIIYNGKSKILKLGNNIEIIRNDEKIYVNYKLEGSIKDRINVLLCLKSLCSGKLKFNDKIIFKNISKNNQDISNIEAAYQFYNDILTVFNQLGIIKELNIDSFTSTDKSNLYYFIRGIKYGEPISYKKESGPVFFRFPNVNILCFCNKIEDDKCVIKNFFEKNLLHFKAEFCNEIVDISKYCVLVQDNCNGFELVDNINYDDLINDLKKFIKNNYCLEMTNKILLNLISFYDVHKYIDVLKKCEEIARLIYDNYNDELYELNYYQVKKRLNNLSVSDINRIVEIKNSTCKQDCKWACNVLLDSKIEAQICFNNLQDDCKKLLESLPMFTIYKLLK